MLVHCRCRKSACCRGNQVVLQAALAAGALQFSVITALGCEGAALMGTLKFSVYVVYGWGVNMAKADFPALVLPLQFGKNIWL